MKVVILGQDPYFTEGDACGLAFSRPGPISKIPPSLKNIFKEYCSDLKYLVQWAKEGVLLLNSVLTVEPGKPMSHDHIGWNELTEEILFTVHEVNPRAVFILWGKAASEIASPWIGSANRVQSSHPSPRSSHAGFFGSRPFTSTNALLESEKVRPVNWRLP